jgi:hypothetical protein
VIKIFGPHLSSCGTGFTPLCNQSSRPEAQLQEFHTPGLATCPNMPNKGMSSMGQRKEIYYTRCSLGTPWEVAQ